jgi:ribosomal-protein-alanine N-acetyltransferase
MPVMDIGIRFLSRNDLDQIVVIDRQIFPFPWSKTDFLEARGPGTSCYVLVAAHEGRICGYAVFEWKSHSVEIVRMAVAEEYRRKGIATAMFAKIRDKMWAGSSIVFHVRERYLEAHLFLQKQGLVATVEKNYFANQQLEDEDESRFPWHFEDAYRFSATTEQG